VEGEQERAVLEDLVQHFAYRTADQVIRILDVLKDVGIELVVVEDVCVNLG